MGPGASASVRPHAAREDRGPGQATARRIRRHAARLARRRGARRRHVLLLGPLLPPQRRPGRQPLRVHHDAGLDGRGDRARRDRRARDLQLLPQPRAAGRRPPDAGPHLGRTGDPRHRRGLVRARLRRVRLRVRHQGLPPARARGGAPAHQVPPRAARAAARARDADPHRRRPARRSPSASSRSTRTPGTPSATSEAFREKDGILREHCARAGRDPDTIERTWAAPRDGAAADALVAAGVSTSSSGSTGTAQPTTSARCASSSPGGTRGGTERWAGAGQVSR